MFAAKESSSKFAKTGIDRHPSLPSISLPNGGGAIRGIGEKFTSNPVTGTGSLSVPIYTSPGRSGFGPQLSLSYDSGAGNGPFGFGWNLSLPSIMRKTDKGLPIYQDDDESDTFILSGVEDLVPVLVQVDGQWQRDMNLRTLNGVDYCIQRYQPRVEGLFARIERWTNLRTGEIHWRSISRDNITTMYGKTAESRIADPDDPQRVFSWLICESYDDKGNAILYEYKAENSQGIDLFLVHERNRTDATRAANHYLKRIKYGNKTPYKLGEDLTARNDWMFEVVFDYGEHYSEDNQGQPTTVFLKNDQRPWKVRLDPFSSYRAGFEIRTYRLCRRVLMFHHFHDELGADDYLVRSTDFTYAESSIASFITSITQSGYVRRKDGKYLKKSLPPLEFGYSQATIRDEIQEIDADCLKDLPSGLDGTRYQWVDLDGEGVSGILTEQEGALFYKRNLSSLPVLAADGKPTILARFAPVEKVATIPSLTNLRGGRQQLMDLAGDGQLDLVHFDAPLSGYFERTLDEKWESFIQFASVPNVPWHDPNLRFVDLTGDGHADILITEDEAFTWYPSLAERGFAEGKKVRQALDDEKGPRLFFADATESIYLADVSGDGMVDLVRIRNGEVCYWPNLGYGRFGAKVTMDNAPWFDTTDQFDQRRIRLADIDGSGVTDIIYIGHDGVRLYFNQSGNSWSDARTLTQFPQTDNLSLVMVVDLLGNGTACLVWWSPLPEDARRPIRYINLMGGQKPHLLVSVKNNMGAETRVQYASSTKFYLMDKAAGKPWITRLPFPVQVVERVETHDWISRNRFVTRYAYHHGYFDGIEREFRGFGMVEQWDTEEIGTVGSEITRGEDTNWDTVSFVPPVLTRTWFHVGAYSEEGFISKHFAEEYYREGDPSLGEGELSDKELQALLLSDTVLPNDLTAEEVPEACRSLKGGILRQEIYALDRRPDGTLTEESDRPYAVSERNYTIRRLQPREENKHAVFFVHPRETIDFYYERKLYDIVVARQTQKRADPRITHSVTLEVDEYGNVLKSVVIGYGRRQPDSNLSERDQEKQTQTLITYTENRYTNLVLQYDAYRTPLQSETRTFEVLKVEPPSGFTGVTALFPFDRLQELVVAVDFSQGNWDIPYHDVRHTQATGNHPYRRLIEHVRTVYRSNQLDSLLPLGQVDSLALPGETYKLAFTPGLLAAVYQRERTGQPPENLLPNPSAVLGSKDPDGGGYVDLDEDGNWWIPSGRIYYSPNRGDTSANELSFAIRHFFLPHRLHDPFDHVTMISYDVYDLLLLESVDPLVNRVTAGERDAQGNITNKNDYRVLQPALVTDPNGAVSEALFDALGLVVATAVHKENVGDSLQNVQADITQKQVDDFFADPRGQAVTRLGTATTCIVYDMDRYYLTSNPDKAPYAATVARETHVSDPVPAGGLKIQIGFSYFDGFGREIQKKIQAEPGPVNGVDTDPRWVGSGWTIFNNKGKPVRKYEPFFDDIHDFRYRMEVGVCPILFYDPVDRVVATLHPNNTYAKVVFDPWHQKTYDVNDTVTLDPHIDEDIRGYVAEYFTTQPATWQRWYEQRIGGALGGEEQKAAQKTEAHANTPTVAYFDSLGRTFLTVASNGKDVNGNNVFYETHIVLDIEGNQREVVDAKGRTVVRYDYDMLGNRIKQASMEAGARWVLNNSVGNPVRTWDSRYFNRRMTYDTLQRPVGLFVADATGMEFLAEKNEYGESKPNPEMTNHRLKAWRVYDGAGVVVNDSYDFKGNLELSKRQLLSDYKAQVDWAQNPQLETETFTGRTRYDALNRPNQIVAPHGSKDGTKINVIQPVYNDANLLERMDVWLEEEVEPTVMLDLDTATLHAVTNFDYNAKGQRELIEYGNGVITSYEYDSLTFRLTHLQTLRGTDKMQNLFYTYDPTGNITEIRDDAQQTVFFRGRRVEPSAEYTYDAIYRLIEAKGREQLGRANGSLSPLTPTSYSDDPRVNLLHPGNGDELGTYLVEYKYDPVGNIEWVNHQGTDPSNPGWTRTYSYDESSQIESGVKSNRLTSTSVLSRTELYDDYDEHGNMKRMPHLSLMRWDYRDMLQATSMQRVTNGGSPETTYYVYDSSGQRVRKVTEYYAPQGETPRRKDERIYLGGFEIYRKYDGDGNTVKLERETLHINDDKQRIALIETRTKGDDGSPQQVIRYQFGNHLGSACFELDHEAKIISYEEYYPYGSTSYQAGRTMAEVKLKRYRYTGKERDEESGFYYHGARFYASWLARWVSCDPTSDTEHVNLYAFVKNNPIAFIDDDGTEEETPWWKYVLGVPFAAIGFVFGGMTGGIDPANAPELGQETIPRLTTTERALNIAPLFVGAGAAGLTTQTLARYGVRPLLNQAASWGVFGGVASVSGVGIRDVRERQFSGFGSYAEAFTGGTTFGVLTFGAIKTIGGTFDVLTVGLLRNARFSGVPASARSPGRPALVRSSPEQLFRRMSFKEAKATLSEGALQASEHYPVTWVSPNKLYVYNYPTKTGIENYDVVIRFILKPGTLARLRATINPKNLRIERGAETMGVSPGMLGPEQVVGVEVYSTQPTILNIMRGRTNALGQQVKPPGYRYSAPSGQSHLPPEQWHY